MSTTFLIVGHYNTSASCQHETSFGPPPYYSAVAQSALNGPSKQSPSFTIPCPPSYNNFKPMKVISSQAKRPDGIPHMTFIKATSELPFMSNKKDTFHPLPISLAVDGTPCLPTSSHSKPLISIVRPMQRISTDDEEKAYQTSSNITVHPTKAETPSPYGKLGSHCYVK